MLMVLFLGVHEIYRKYISPVLSIKGTGRKGAE